MKKTWYAVSILLLAMFLVVACSSKENSSAANHPAATDGQSAPEESPNTTAPKSNYPSRNVDMLVGYAAGGGTDLFARVVTSMLNDSGIVQKPFVVNNITGGSGALALTELKNRKGDDHVLLTMVSIGTPIATGSIDATYDDFTPIAQLAADTSILVVKGDSPYKNIDEFLKQLKADPQSIAFGTAGRTASDYYAIVRLGEKLGIKEEDMVLVPLDGGPSIVTNVLGGKVDAAVTIPSNVNTHLESGDMRGLATTSDQRLKLFPDIPTLVESGIDMVELKGRAIWAAKDVSQEVVQFWENALSELTKTKEWSEYLDKYMIVDKFVAGEQYIQSLKEEGKAYREWYESNK